MTVRLDELVDVDRYAGEVSGGWVQRQVNAADRSLMVFSYTPVTQFAAHWGLETRLSRGLVVRVPDDVTALSDSLPPNMVGGDRGSIAAVLRDAVVVSRGLMKFFTVEAPASGSGFELVDDDEDVRVQGSPDVDFDAPASVSDKLDGALGIGLVLDSGDGPVMSLCTKGAFASPEAVAGTRLLRSRHDARGLARLLARRYPDRTLLFEIISSAGEHIVQYGDYEDVVLLGMVDNRTGYWTPATLLGRDRMTDGDDVAAGLAWRFRFDTPEVMRFGTLRAALDAPERMNREGVVVTIDHGDGAQSMYKVKYDTFLQLRRFRDMFDQNAAIEVVRGLSDDELLGDGMPDFSAVAPPEVRRQARQLMERFAGTAYRTYVLPIRSLTKRALASFGLLSCRFDLLDAGGRGGYADAVNTLYRRTGEEDVIRGILFALASLTRGLGRMPGEAELRSRAIDAAKRQLLRNHGQVAKRLAEAAGRNADGDGGAATGHGGPAE